VTWPRAWSKQKSWMQTKSTRSNACWRIYDRGPRTVFFMGRSGARPNRGGRQFMGPPRLLPIPSSQRRLLSLSARRGSLQTFECPHLLRDVNPPRPVRMPRPCQRQIPGLKRHVADDALTFSSRAVLQASGKCYRVSKTNLLSQ
jgi:hypothetical protein